MHGIGLRPGARLLGVIGMVIGLDDTDTKNSLGVEARMYRCLPGGTLDRCNVCCTGGGADAVGNAARKYATEILSRVVVSSTVHGGDNESLLEEGIMITSNDELKLQQVIEEVGRMALKYHHGSEIDAKVTVHDNKRMSRCGVDIWLVRAAASTKLDATVVINPHRFLGKALLETRYARSVALDQLSDAAKCLMNKQDMII